MTKNIFVAEVNFKRKKSKKLFPIITKEVTCQICYKITKFQNSSIKVTGRVKSFHKKVKVFHADPGAKKTDNTMQDVEFVYREDTSNKRQYIILVKFQ